MWPHFMHTNSVDPPPPIVIVLEHEKMRLVKGGHTGIILFGLTDESVVRKALLADECEACVWRVCILP